MIRPGVQADQAWLDFHARHSARLGQDDGSSAQDDDGWMDEKWMDEAVGT